MDLSVTGMRVLREVAERGSFTAAATALGYTQSAVSRQVAALETTLGVAVFQRQRTGVRLTAPGRAVLRHVTAALDEIDAALRAVRGPAPATEVVRLGTFTSAGAVLLPRTLAALRDTHPGIEVSTREGSTPALVRAVRAGSLDLAVVATTPPFRPLDGESPELVVRLVAESQLHVAVPATHPLALGDTVDFGQLQGQRWIASPSSDGEVLLGVWPGLGGRPRVAHTTRDWLAKLQLVAAGCGLTTVPASLLSVVPAGVRVLPVHGGPREARRVLTARLPGRRAPAVRIVEDAFRATAETLRPGSA